MKFKVPQIVPIKIRKPTKMETVAMVWLGLLAIAFIFGRKSVKLLPEAPSPLEKIGTKIGEVNLPAYSPPEAEPPFVPEVSGTTEGQAKLKVLNANLIGVYDKSSDPGSKIATDPGSSSNKLTGIRILGEVQNIGNKKAQAMKAIVRFYNKVLYEASVAPKYNPQKELVASKVANFNQGYYWLPLSAGETNVYDILVPNPPESETITIEMMPAKDTSQESVPDTSEVSSILKIKDKNLESASVKRGQDELAYFKFKAILINTGTEQIINPGLYVWLKNDEGKVIGLGSKVFEADILSANQELEVNLILAPLATGTLFGYEVKTFGESL